MSKAGKESEKTIGWYLNQAEAKSNKNEATDEVKKPPSKPEINNDYIITLDIEGHGRKFRDKASVVEGFWGKAKSAVSSLKEKFMSRYDLPTANIIKLGQRAESQLQTTQKQAQEIETQRATLQAVAKRAEQNPTPAETLLKQSEALGALAQREAEARTLKQSEALGVLAQREAEERTLKQSEALGALAQREAEARTLKQSEALGVLAQKEAEERTLKQSESLGALAQKEAEERTLKQSEALGALAQREAVQRAQKQSESLGALAQREATQREEKKRNTPANEQAPALEINKNFSEFAKLLEVHGPFDKKKNQRLIKLYESGEPNARELTNAAQILDTIEKRLKRTQPKNDKRFAQIQKLREAFLELAKVNVEPKAVDVQDEEEPELKKAA